MDNLTSQFWEYIIFPLIALFGGIVKYLNSVINGKQFSWLAFCVEAFTALFLGLLITFVGKEMSASPYWLGACSGLGGWLGAEFVKNLLRHYSRIPIPEDKPKK